MDCAGCGRANRAGAKFCGGCGKPLAPRCPACGIETQPGSQFCDACGASLVAPQAAAAEARKVVTIVFADLIGSTALHERLDAESARRLMDRYHRSMGAVVEAHGGTVMQLLGDGVLAGFGVPRVAEDDAIRAVRAAVGMQQAFRELAREQAGLAGEIGLRVAVYTGEVVAGDDHTHVMGDPVNVAARLQQEARDGDVLLGESTHRLVSERVTLAPIGSFTLKGRAEPVAAYRVLSLERPAGAPAIAFVGREDELRRIRAVYDTAVATRAARLAVLLGSPGLGKSRLIDEFTRRLGDGATVLLAHCDAAGGATFAPLAEALRGLLRIDDGAGGDALRAAILSALPEGEPERARIADGVAALVAGTPTSPEEIFFVVRRGLAALAVQRPVVLAIDDIQWAEPLLLDLIEHLVQWGSDVPLLVLVAARPELRDTRSSLATSGGLVSDVVTLTGLDAGAATRLAANVIGAEALPAAIAGRVLATSEGNPLFVGELVRMLVHDGALKREGDRWTAGVELADLEMPPTIHALLAARIERLRPEERTVLERAAVIGRHFSRAALAQLLPREITDLDARLESLRRSELVEPDTGWFLGEPVLRFHHVLIRDAAYRRLLKNTRAELHGRFADWLEARAAGAVEHDETLGWHLEQAHQHLLELGPIDAQGRALGERAARHLAAAGRRALARDDLTPAASLLERALARLDAADPARADLTLDWCEALLSAGDVGTAVRAVAELGRFIGDSDRLRAWHTCFGGQLAVFTDPKALRASAEAVEAAAVTLTSAGDAAGEAKAHSVHALVLAQLGKIGACEAALDKALAAARRARDRRRANAVLAGAPVAALWGPSPVTRASGRCLDVVRVLRITQGAPAVEAVALRCQAVLETLRGRAEAARRMIASSRRMVEELGITQRVLEADLFAGLIELLEGDAAAAERCLRVAYDGLRAQGLGIDAAQAAALLGRALLAQGRIAEAEAISVESESLAGDSFKAAIAWRGVRAEALAARGEHAAAIEFARAAVEIAAATDDLLDHADARQALAVALRAAGRSAEANAEEKRAIELWEAKGATLLAERARRGATRSIESPRSPEPSAAPAQTVLRRVRRNAATAVMARTATAVEARDADAIAALFSDAVECVDHSTGASYGREGFLASLRSLSTVRDLTFQHEPLAVLGNSLALSRRNSSATGVSGKTFDIGAYERDALNLFEVDEQPVTRRIETFAVDRLGDAIARLYQRYAELLPDGPERTRAAATARSVAAHMGPHDVARYATAIAPAIEFADHRTMGFEALRGADGMLRVLRSIGEVAHDVANRVDDVLDLRFNAYLLRWRNFGTDRAGGGAFERHLLVLWVFGTDGLVTRWELFDANREAEALACFDELTAELPRSERRVRPNAASTATERLGAAFAARDAGALAGLFADDYDSVEHPTGAALGREALLASLRAALRSSGPSFRYEHLATLGESLVLQRRWWSFEATRGGHLDVAASEKEGIGVCEVDERGRFSRGEFFAADHLGDAIARLYERYAELLPDGPERTRAAVTARSVAATRGVFFPDRYASALAPAIEIVDHRILGTLSASGAEAALQNLRSFLAVADDYAVRVDDVLSLKPGALLSRGTTCGTDRAGGGAFERPFISIQVFGADGLLTRIELFDADRDTEALARFDELTAEPPKSERRVRLNAATANAARFDAAVAARDANAFETLLADHVESVDHTLGLEYDRQATIDIWRSVLKNRDTAFRNEPLATLGDSLALGGVSISASASVVGKIAVGAVEWENLVLAEVDAPGRRRRAEVFPRSRLGDAIARLYERYAELLPEGPARTRAAATARSVAAEVGPLDLDRYAAALAPAIESVDHRTLGTWSARGAEAFLKHFRSLLDLAADVAMREDDILGLRSDAFLVLRTRFGTERAGGGAYERNFLWLGVFGSDGLLTRVELFDGDRGAEALARFDALTAEPPKSERRVRPNAATANAARMEAVIAARDADALPTLFADRFDLFDHPNGIEYDRQASLNSWRSLLRVQEPTYRQEPLATLGESLALYRESWSGIGGGKLDVGAFERERIVLLEVDAQGRRRRAEVFAIDHLGDALARLYERYAELRPDDPTRARAAATARSLAASLLIGAFDPVDTERLRTALAPDLVYVDRRTVGLGSIHGAEAFLRAVDALIQLSEDFTLRIDDILDLRSNAALLRVTTAGTDRASGGAFERPFLLLLTFGSDGLVARWEQFDVDRDAEALARFDALTAEPPKADRRVRLNAATANAARVDAVIAVRDADALPTLFADTSEAVDHTTGTTWDRQGLLATWRSLLRSRDPTARHEPLATLGDSLALCRASTSAGGFAGRTFDVGAHEREEIHLIEVDAQGRRRQSENFAADRMGDAVARLYARYAELLPEGPARTRAAATARSVAALLGPFDPDRYAAAFAPAIEVVDRRILGTMTARGAEAHVQNLRSWLLLSDDAAMRQDEILALQSDAYLARRMFFATDRAGGGAFERPFIQLWVVGGDGLLTRFEYFDADRADEAFARFDELTAEPPRSERRVRANAATAHAARLDAAIAAGDADALSTLFADKSESVDHITGTTFDQRGLLGTWRSLLSARDPTSRHEPLASLGDSLALCRLSTSASGFAGRTFDVGPYETDNVILIEADAQGQRRRSENFASDRLGDAIARLYERYAELLPEGPARTRAAATARSVAALLGPFDPESYAAANSPTVEAVDHRILGTWSASGVETRLQHYRSLLEVADDIVIRNDEVLSLQPDALLVRQTHLGTDRAGGGAYERPYFWIGVFGPEGLMTHNELFDPARDAEALARFDALTAEPPRSLRRVRPNAATAHAARLDATIAARDAGALPSLVAESSEVREHATATTYDRQGVLASWRSLLSARDPKSRHEPLASLGDSLALFRVAMSGSGFAGRTFDVGPYQIDNVVLIEVDAQGRRGPSEVFLTERLGDAAARLYERYAELLPDGPARTRAAGTARAVVALSKVDDELWATAIAPAIEVVDHRILGTFSGSGKETLLQGIRSWLELGVDLGMSIDDVLRLESGALLTRRTFLGSDRAGGGPFEREMIQLLLFGTDGLVTRIELFDLGHEASALARFDALTTESPRFERRMRANAATAQWARVDAAVAARDADALSALVADAYEVTDHTTGVSYGRQGEVSSYRALLRARDPTCRHEPLASLGDSLGLCRVSISASGFAGGTLDLGAYEREQISLIEVDAQGRHRWAELFATDRLGDAIVRLYERFAELLPVGPARARAAATARSVAAQLGPFDPDRYAAANAPTVEFVDHRTLGTWSAHGAEAVLQNTRSWFEIVDDPANRVDDILGLRSDAFLIHWTHLGTDRTGGGVYENRFLVISVFGPDGLVTRTEMFDSDRNAEALARFDELTAEPPAARFANAAWRAMERFERCWGERDWDGVVATVAPTHTADDRRRLVGLQMSADESFASLRFVFEMPANRWHNELLATRGERLVLFRVRITGQTADSGPMSAEHLQLTEVDADGRQAAIVVFDLDALDAAYAELDARYDAGEAAPHAGTWETAQRLSRILSARDWEQWPSVFTEDFVLQDHRLLGWGTRSSDEFLAQTRAMAELAPDFRFRGDHTLAINRRGMLSVGGWVGSREGGPFEISMVSVTVLGPDGRLRRIDTYDLDQLDAARACFEALTAEPLAPAARIENAATRAERRIQEAWDTRDWEGFAALFPAGLRNIDRRKMVQLELDRDQYLDSFRPAFEMTSSRRRFEVFATRGNRLAIVRVSWEGAGRSVGLSGQEFLGVLEVDDAGAPVAWVVFDPDDLDAAWAEIDARYHAGEAAPHARVAAGMREFTRAFTERDWDALAARCAPDLVVHDRRLLGWETLHGPAAYVEALRSLVELAPDTKLRLDHVTMSALGYLVITVWEGTREGGAYEAPSLMVAELDALGRIRRFDQYDLERLDQARARFEELRPDPLRIPPNAATRTKDRWQEAFEAGAWEALGNLCASAFVFEDRRRAALTTGDREIFVTSTRIIASAGTRMSRALLATAGDRLALEYVFWEATDGAAFEAETLSLWEVDAEGRIVAAISFDRDNRRAASAELLARDPHSDAIKRAMSDHDLDRLRAALPDDFVMNDHRRTGLGQLAKDDFVTSLAALFGLAPDVIVETLYTVAADQHANLSTVRMFGTLTDGGAFESFVVRLAWFRDDRIVGQELFEPEGLDAARARFEELRPDPLRIPPNAATRAGDRWVECIAAEDWDALRALCAPIVFEDRRRLARTTGACEMVVTNSQVIAELGGRASRTLLATSGDRLSLERVLWTATDQGAASEVDTLQIMEVDAEGRVVATIVFDPDDRRAASAELLARDPRSDMVQRALGDHDLDRLRTALPDDFAMNDHRRTGLGQLGRDDYLTSLVALFGQAPDVIIESLYIVAAEKHGKLSMDRMFGTLADGGAFESVAVRLASFRGEQTVGMELFELEDLDVARARFEALRSELA